MNTHSALREPATLRRSAPQLGRRSVVSVIVPVVDRADRLSDVYAALAAELEAQSCEYEFFFVFDGSFGQPPPDIAAISREDRRLHLLCFDQTFGEAAALRAGIERSRGDVIVTSAAYFQVQPVGLRDLLEGVGNGTDLVVAQRSPRIDGWLNRLQCGLFHALIRTVSGVRFHDMACGLRAMRREVAESIPLYGDFHRFIPALAAREGFTVREISVPQHPLDARRRLYKPGVYLRRVLDILAFFFLAKFTEKPLRFFGLMGALLAGAGTALCGLLLIQRLLGTGIANRPLLLLGVLLLAVGVQVTGLGLVGEVIVHLRSPHRRSYRVRETT